MAEERDNEQTKETEATSGQQPTTQQNQQPPIAGQHRQQSEFVQEQDEQAGDLASQQTTTGERSTGQSGQGFIGSQATGSDESSETLDRSDFANQGQGATKGLNENIETGERKESESDTEGTTDAT